jgi:hypothetical protein
VRVTSAVSLLPTDSLFTQLTERFQTEDLNMLTAMSFFSPTALISEKQLATENDIRVLCAFYDIDTQTVVAELTAFRHIYRQLQGCVHMDDLLAVNSTCRTGNVNQNVRQSGQNVFRANCVNYNKLNTVTGSQSIISVSLNSDAANLSLPEAASLSKSPVLSDVQDQLENSVYVAHCSSLITDNIDIADVANIQHAWVQHGFIKPFRLLHQLSGSGFGTLMYAFTRF